MIPSALCISASTSYLPHAPSLPHPPSPSLSASLFKLSNHLSLSLPARCESSRSPTRRPLCVWQSAAEQAPTPHNPLHHDPLRPVRFHIASLSILRPHPLSHSPNFLTFSLPHPISLPQSFSFLTASLPHPPCQVRELKISNPPPSVRVAKRSGTGPNASQVSDLEAPLSPPGPTPPGGAPSGGGRKAGVRRPALMTVIEEDAEEK